MCPNVATMYCLIGGASVMLVVQTSNENTTTISPASARPKHMRGML